MPIDRIEREVEALPFGAGLNKFGTIRKGLPPDSAGRMTDLTYFRSTFYPEYAGLASAFDEMFGSQPETIEPLFLIGDTALEAFDYWMEEHTKTKTIHKCDEITQVQHFVPATGKNSFEPTACIRGENHDGCKCKPTARFHVILPEFCRLVSRIGYFTVHTTSIYDIISLRRYLKDIETMNGGRVSGIPLILGRAERDVSVPKPNGKALGDRMIVKKSLLYISPVEGYVSNVLLPAYTDHAYALANGELQRDTGEVIEMAALPAHVEEDVLEVDPPHPPRAWDTEKVMAKTSSMFDAPDHQENAIRQMLDTGELNNDMDDSAAIAAISANRNRRTQEKIDAADAKKADEAQWASDPKTVAKFLKGAKDNFKFNTQHVLNALDGISPERDTPLESVDQFVGSRELAWAACIAHYLQYQRDRVATYLVGEKNDAMRAAVLHVIDIAVVPF